MRYARAMAVTPARAHALALSLDGASEKPHFERSAFRTPRKTFATLAGDGSDINVMFDADTQAFYCDAEPAVFTPVPGGWGRMGATRCDLARRRGDAKGRADIGARAGCAKKEDAEEDGQPVTTPSTREPMRKALLAVFLIGLNCCATNQPTSDDDVYINPALHVGTSRTVCGWLSGAANISRADPRTGESAPGLSVRNLGPWERGRREFSEVCLEGTIVDFGCGEDDIICTDAHHPYGIEVSKVHWNPPTTSSSEQQ